MTVHSHCAADAVLDAYGRCPGSGIVILHWFSGPRAELDRAVAMGCWFLVGPPMARSRRGRGLPKAMPMPRDRVLTETDGPFGTGRAGPLGSGDVADAMECLASACKMSTGEAGVAVSDNLRQLGLGARTYRIDFVEQPTPYQADRRRIALGTAGCPALHGASGKRRRQA